MPARRDRLLVPGAVDLAAWPPRLAPMLPTAAPALPADDGGWSYEVKWDGYRALAWVGDGRVRVLTRNGRVVSPQVPELGGLAPALPRRRVVLDGELVALAADGRPSFARLQARMGLTRARDVDARAREIPLTYMIFDLLHLDGASLIGRPYEERRVLLESLGLRAPRWQVPPAHRGDGAALLAATRELGLEGVVAKRLGSPYAPGRRSPAWWKVKNFHRRAFVVGGWVPATSCGRGLGVLLVGTWEADALVFAGEVGAGIGPRAGAALRAAVDDHPRATSPFARTPRVPDARWTEPRLVVEVQYLEWPEGGVLRHTSWKGVRADREPASVTRAPADATDDAPDDG